MVAAARIMGDTVERTAARMEARMMPPTTGEKCMMRVVYASFASVMVSRMPISLMALADMPSMQVKNPKGTTTSTEMRQAFFATLGSLAARTGWMLACAAPADSTEATIQLVTFEAPTPTMEKWFVPSAASMVSRVALNSDQPPISRRARITARIMPKYMKPMWSLFVASTESMPPDMV